MVDPRQQPWLVLGLEPLWFPELTSSGLSTSSPTDDATRTALIHRAYRRALLQHHPDKQRQQQQQQQQHTPQVAPSTPSFTVDDIKAAYAALGGRGGPDGRGPAETRTVLGGLSIATGLEVVDLDELPYDELSETQTWYRGCRCGNPRGFTFTEQDLEEEMDAEAMETLVAAEDDDDDDGRGSGANNNMKKKGISVGELLVGCQDCSLWLCVHFAAAPDDEDDDNGDDGYDDDYEKD